MQRSPGNDESTSGNAAAESGNRLIQNRILPTCSKSRKKRGDRGTVCLIDRAAGNELIDEVLIRAAQQFLRFGIHVEEGELSWDEQSQIACQRLLHLIDVHLQHDLRL